MQTPTSLRRPKAPAIKPRKIIQNPLIIIEKWNHYLKYLEKIHFFRDLK